MLLPRSIGCFSFVSSIGMVADTEGAELSSNGRLGFRCNGSDSSSVELSLFVVIFAILVIDT